MLSKVMMSRRIKAETTTNTTTRRVVTSLGGYEFCVVLFIFDNFSIVAGILQFGEGGRRGKYSTRDVCKKRRTGIPRTANGGLTGIEWIGWQERTKKQKCIQLFLTGTHQQMSGDSGICTAEASQQHEDFFFEVAEKFTLEVRR